MTPEQYLDAILTLPRAYGVYVSPDGKWVAWSWIGAHPQVEVYCAPTDGSHAPVRLTDTPENTFLVAWTPDSQAVLVSEDKDGNERSRLFCVDIDEPLTMVPLTEENPNYYLRGGALHPNEKWLVYGANANLATGEEIEPVWVYRHDLETGERRPLAKPLKGGFTYPRLNHTGTHILYNRLDLDPAGNQEWLVDIEGTDDREILNFGAHVKTFSTWFPDGQRVLFGTETPTYTRLGIWDLRTRTIRWLIDDPARNIENWEAPSGTDYIVLHEQRQARIHASLLHPETGEEIHLPDLPGNLFVLAPVGNREWIGVYSSSRQPPDVVRFSLDDVRPEAFKSISRVWERTTLTPADLTAAEDFRWKSVDGLEIHGWLYRPQGEARGTVVYIHGGPTAHSSDAINGQIQFFVREGFNVLDPNYRGSTGYNIAFRESIKEDGWGGREQDDIRAGIEALIAAGIAQPGKVGITGTSYGGYSSWHAITHFPREVLAASAPVCGMTDLVVDYQTTRPDLRPYSEEMLGGTPDTVPQKYFERSPVNFVQHIKGELMIIQGMQDPNVTPQNVTTVTNALRDTGVEYQLLAFEDEGHGIIRQKNQKTLFVALRDFFGQAFG
jgi:poly(3-hydroxybutyrate) depolymerase